MPARMPFLKLTVLTVFGLVLLSHVEWLAAFETSAASVFTEQKNDPLPAAKSEFFEARIRPLLSTHCYGCHTDTAKGGLRLDSRAAILKGGHSGAAIVPGNPDESLLVKAVAHTHEKIRMPLGAPKLRNDELLNLRQWIKDGAVWPETPQEFFATQVLPLLKNNCFACHAESAMAKLRLDSREAILKGGQSGAAIVPGHPAKSLLIRAVRGDHGIARMPPARRLTETEIITLEQWIKDGAVWETKTVAANKGFVITPEQKAHWAYQPLQFASVPKVLNGKSFQSSIDYFIQQKWREKNLKPVGMADKRTLIRRATFDLTGLPPTPADVDAFLNDSSPKAFARVIDRLLASPQYGERWGRFWLDLVRYSDTAGDSADYPIPQMYLYRNYVIDSFNQDKPYNQFIREQLAGDLLPANGEAEKWNRLIATGYIAVSRRFSVVPERYMHLTIDDTIDNVGKTFLGLTVSCARCHDHKYDPLSSRDYYALYGIFDSVRYPFAGSENIQKQMDLVTRLPQAEADKILKPYTDRLEALDRRIEDLKKERRFVESGVVPPGEKNFVKSTRTTKEIDKESGELRKQRRELAAQVPTLEKAFAVVEARPHDAPILLRGELTRKGEVVPRRFLQILGGQSLPPNCKTSGRLELADWIADPKNPLTARVMVNRIWQQHFGKGLVQSVSDFGKRGKAPTHPELLDSLATHFIQSGWSVKAMHRMMMLSQTYQLASEETTGRRGDGETGRWKEERRGKREKGTDTSSLSPSPRLPVPPSLFTANAAIDVSNDYLWRFNPRRLDAEAIRDAMLFVSGELDLSKGEAHPFPHESTWKWTQHNPFNAVYDSKRRSVYLMTQRIQRHPYLAMFDGADTNAHTAERAISTTPIQSLFAMNSEFLHVQSESLARRLLKLAPANRQRLEQAYRIVFGRAPTAEELQRSESWLRTVADKIKTAGRASEEVEQQSLASFLRVLLGSNEFIFVD